MSDSVQGWLLSRKGFVTLINDRLANRGGVIGRLFTWLKVGPRQMGAHTAPKVLRYVNHYLMASYHYAAVCRPIATRLVGVTHGPLNYSGIMMWGLMTGIIINRFRC